MKVSFLVLISIFLLIHTSAFGQRVSLSVRGATLEHVLDEISKQTNSLFLYKDNLIKNIKVSSFQVKNVRLTQVLDKLCQHYGLDYRIIAGTITIFNKESPAISDVSNQEKVWTVRGKVISDPGSIPMVGVTVKNVNHKLSTMTDTNGYFTVAGRYGDTISFQHIGYVTYRRTLGIDRMDEVILNSSVLALGEVVVTGYGDLRTEEYSGSVKVLTSEDMANRPISSFEHVLAGRVPGLIVSSSGQPGDIAQVRLRGFGSMSSSNQPLYVIDGIIFDQDNTSGHSNAASSPMAMINPADIANITVLKDAASASLYGSQGANGVIVITTKQGIPSNRMRFGLSAQSGVSNIFSAVKPEFVTAEQYKELWTEGQLHRLIAEQAGNFKENLDDLYSDKLGYFLNGLNYYQWHKLAQQEFNNYYALQKPDGTYYNYDFWGDDADKLPNTDWYDEITRTAGFRQYNLSINGGSTNFTYFLSLGYLDQEGIILNSNLKRYAMRVNLNSDDKKKWITWGLNSTISSTSQSGPLTSGLSYNMPHYAALLLPPVIPAYLEDGSYNFRFPNNLLNENHNPIASAYDNIRQRPQFSLLTSGWARIKFKPWLNFTSDLMQYYVTGRRMEYFDKDFGSGFGTNGVLTNYHSRRVKITNRNTLNFNYTLDNKHRFNALAALELADFNQEWNSIDAVNFMTDEKPVLSTGAEMSNWSGSGYDYAMVSLVSKIDYSWRYKYFLGASFRQDRSSRFSPEHRTGNFWSVSGAYRITNESWDWVKSIKPVFNNIKFKGSYGYNGTLPSSYYNWRTLFNGTGRYNAEHALSQSFRATYDLSWEKNKILNVGVDLGILKDRIKVSAEYYRRRSSDLLQDVPVSKVSGYSTMLMNTTAGIVNKGFEMDLDAKVVDKLFKWNIQANVATLRARYYGLEQDIIGTHIMRNGESVSSWFLNEFAGINSHTGQLLFYTYDKFGNKIIANNDYPSSRHVMGKGIPTATGGFTNTLSFRGWNLMTLLTYGWGHQVLDGRKSRIGLDGQSVDYNIDSSQLDRWTPDNIYASSRIRINGQLSPGSSTRYLYKGDYLKLKNIQLGYTFAPNTFRKLHINHVSLYGQAENVWVWTTLKGYDPDLQLDGFVMPAKYPSATTFTLGLNMNF
ncbi:SusC/RagA family TonB-linked outer membrane protein [Sphingobacterium sp. SGG-5]|uniref:SusC/RagA family TonB-linked outer membrane protein n=1 Tax=Sphingobacterium sp. SGG-5 TaxID=2710881 RepID=UPI0013EDED82|nr:SusC/RagA family TonB-linked outer membrane protein [Sphingobacterium sp. SGG-5]NGM61231.1 SusC/RagA family TonB-linked outer membrane protein [Sphingobacterium sp. SGG-5]